MRNFRWTLELVTVIVLAAATLSAQTPVVSGIVSAATFDSSQVASLGYAAVFGSGLADKVYVSPDANYGTKLGPTEIFICPTQAFPGSPATICIAARIVFASPGQVNIVLPAFAGSFSYKEYVAARVNGVIDAGMSSGSPVATSVNSFAPGIFLAGSDCLTSVSSPIGCTLQSTPATLTQVERGVVTDSAGRLLWSGNPARLGQYYTAWLTGMGTIPVGHTVPVLMPILVPAYGYPSPSGGNLNVTYSGDVPQYPGLYQVNFQIPLSIGEGPFGYGAWPCGSYNWELPMQIVEVADLYSDSTSNSISIPLVIKNGDVPCKP